jgi:hypothetical protein
VRRLIILGFLLAFSVTGSISVAGAGDLPAANELPSAISKAGLQYFFDHAHPATGLVRDRADNFNLTPDSNRAASIAATGFGLTVVTNAAVRGVISQNLAQDYVLRSLRFALEHVPRFHGWFVHFVDWETGERLWKSEFSTIDTAFFLAGALYAAQVFPNNAEIRELAYKIYRDVDFIDLMTDGGTRPDKRTLSMAYSPENGYTASQWSMYAEQMILLILGLGHPTHPLPMEAWLGFSRAQTRIPEGPAPMGLQEALFVHQYSHLFVNFSGVDDGFPNYFANSRVVTARHRAIGQTDGRFATLRAGFWGFSAGDSPTGYRVASALDYQSTVCVGCAVASVMFMKDDVLQDMARWIEGSYRHQIWGRYGFIDSLDLDHNWFGQEVIGITVGPEVLALANLQESTSVWKDFMKIPEIQSGLRRAQLAGKLAKKLRLQRSVQ